jgi:hypothetical protein
VIVSYLCTCTLSKFTPPLYFHSSLSSPLLFKQRVVGSGIWRHWQIQQLERAHTLLYKWRLLSVSSCSGRGKVLLSLFYGVLSHDPITSQRPHLLKPSHCVLGFQHMNLVNTNIQPLALQSHWLVSHLLRTQHIGLTKIRLSESHCPWNYWMRSPSLRLL